MIRDTLERLQEIEKVKLKEITTVGDLINLLKEHKQKSIMVEHYPNSVYHCFGDES